MTSNNQNYRRFTSLLRNLMPYQASVMKRKSNQTDIHAIWHDYHLVVTLRLVWLLKKGFAELWHLHVSHSDFVLFVSVSVFQSLPSPLSLSSLSPHICHKTMVFYETHSHTTHFSNLLINLAIILSVTRCLLSHKICITLSKWYGPKATTTNSQHNFFFQSARIFFSLCFNFHDVFHTSAKNEQMKKKIQPTNKFE